MGHVRLGQLPRTHTWHQVVAALDVPGPNGARVAAATARGADARIRRLKDDAGLAYCFWLLARMASAARRPDFVDALGDLGLAALPSDSAVGFVARVGARARDEVERHPESGPFGEIASLALRRALTETVGTEGRSLFGSSLEDLETAFRHHATPARFGDLARRFFADFAARTLRFYVDKELALHIGPGRGLDSLAGAEEFVAGLDRYARQSAVIVERFAADWYSKHDWESDGAIGRDEAQAFVAVALGKLRRELQRPHA